MDGRSVTSPLAQRERTLRTLANEPFDLLIVGGGITGCGIARDAALRGLKVALVEKLDFASGTSSKSSKLVHGGLRYLEQLELKLVFESVNERKLLMKRARHLVRPLPFLVSRYSGDKHWLLTLNLGLWLYEALCGFQAYKLHEVFGAEGTLREEPSLRSEGLTGAIRYYDCLTDDVRLTLENAMDASALGAACVTHAQVGALLRDKAGRVIGAKVRDRLGGNGAPEFEVRARVVVNATGPWSDEVRALLGESPILRPTKGVHLVVDAKRLPAKHAWMMTSPRDKRVVFVIPWGLGLTAVGTTDTFFDGNPDNVYATREDVTYLLETANHYCPDAKLGIEDVISTWAGLRPLLKPVGGMVGASEISREHMIYERPGFITIAGGKLTTYRRLSKEVLDKAISQWRSEIACTTGERPLPGTMGVASDEELEKLPDGLRVDGVSAEVKRHWVATYGSRAGDLAKRVTADKSAAESLDAELPYVMAQVDEAVELEHALTLEDVMVRRVPFLLRAKDQGLGAARQVAARMGAKLQWNGQRVDSEVAAYEAEVAKNRAYRGGA